jgi:benzoate-CoA ligase
MNLSTADHSAQPPQVSIPRRYNAAHDLLARNAAWPDKVAFINAISGEQLTYGELTRQSHRFANALRATICCPSL